MKSIRTRQADFLMKSLRCECNLLLSAANGDDRSPGFLTRIGQAEQDL